VAEDWQEGVIRTGADLLLKKVAEEGEIPVPEAAEELGVSETQVEDWAEALDSSDFLEKSYSARKGTVLEYTENNHSEVKERLQQSREEVQKEAERVQNELSDRKQVVEEARKRLEQMEESVEEDRRKEKETREQVEELKELEQDIEQRVEQKEAEIRDLREETADLLSRTETAISDISHAEEKMDEFEQREQELENKLEGLRKLENHVETVDQVQESLREIERADRESKSMVRDVIQRVTQLFRDEDGAEAAAENILDRPISEAKNYIEKAESPDYRLLLKAEKDHKNRETMKSWLEERADA
jgi:chromosome segregation ATPase